MDLDEELVRAFAGLFEIEREIGRGGMGVVYLAYDLRESRKVALKVLARKVTMALARERFVNEIAIQAPLLHPNILPLYGSGKAGAYLYYTMPFVDGPTLEQRLAREIHLPLDEVLDITRQLAAALDYAHSRGVIHRDIKPANILLLEKHVYIADFGLAKAMTSAASTPLTDVRCVVGTPRYMSPEQCTPGRAIDARSDIYSLGCVVCEMITGLPPFRGATDDATMSHHRTSDPQSLRIERRQCPPHVDDAVQRALAKIPADRFRTAGDFASALAHPSPEPVPPVPIPEPPRPRPRSWISRSKLVGGVIGMLVIILIAWGWVWKPYVVHLGNQDWLLVGDFQGPSSEPALSNSVRELVTAELNQSPSLRTVTRQQLNSVMRLAGVAETTHVDADLARQLAVRSAVRAIVVGSVDKLAKDRYSVAIHVVDANSGRNLFSVARSAATAELVSAVGDATRDVRRQLGERQKDIERTLPLVEAATPSFPAFEKYLDGLALVRRGDIAGANVLLRQAIDMDSGFAAAWAAIGADHLSSRQLDSAKYAFSQALRISGRLTQAQKYRLQGDMRYAIDYDVPAAIRWYDFYLAEYPNSVGGHSNRALYLSAIGRYEDAIADLKAAVSASPFGPAHVQLSSFNLAAMLISQGSARFHEADAVIRNLTPPFRWAASLALMGARDQWDRVVPLADSIAQQPRAPAFIRLLGITGKAAALVALDSVGRGAKVLREERETSSGATARWYDRADLLLAIVTGDRPAASPASLGDTSAAALLTVALRSAVAGDTLRALSLLRRVDSASPRDRAILGNGPALVRGWIAARGGRINEVTQRLSAISLAGEHDASILDRVSSIEVRWLVANAYAMQGKLDSAVLHMRYAIAVDRVPMGHGVLRGLVLPAANRQIAKWTSNATR